MQVPGFDLQRQWREIGQKVRQSVEEVFDSSQFILGDAVERFEQSMAELIGVKHAIGVGNGSDALYLALLALDIGPGDEVITTPFTFFATAGAVSRTGATPIFADIDPATYNIDPKDVERRITEKTKGIIPVHLYGRPAPMDELHELANKHGLRIVEDAAQAVGAIYKGKPVGSISDVGCFSFYPTKNLGAAGDAGLVTTDDDVLASRIRSLRGEPGVKSNYLYSAISINSRLDAVQAAVLNVKLPYLERWTNRRIEIAARYTKALEGSALQLPLAFDDGVQVFHQYTVATPLRDELRDELLRRGIGSAVYYPTCLHLQEAFYHLGGKPGDLPHAERISHEVLSLPMFPELTDEEVDLVAATIREILEEKGRSNGVPAEGEHHVTFDRS